MSYDLPSPSSTTDTTEHVEKPVETVDNEEERAAVRDFFASISESERLRLYDLFVNGVLDPAAEPASGQRAKVDGNLKRSQQLGISARNGL